MTEQDWLDSDNHKIILVDISYHDGTGLSEKYFSDHPYTLKFGDSFTDIAGNTVTSVAYDDIVIDISKIITKINSSTSLGSISLLNTQGEYDDMLDITNAWEGHSISIYLGDPTWTKSQFILILEGVVDSLTAPEPSILAVSIRDKKESINLVTQEKLIWNTSSVLNYLNDGTSSTGIYDIFPNMFSKLLYDTTGTRVDFDASLGVVPSGTENALVPICLGSVFNIEPVLIDSFNHVYQVHECPDATNYGITSVTEVRSNGVKLTGVNDSYVDTLIPDTGTAATAGTVTSIVGNSITITGVDFTTNGHLEGVIHNVTLDEARYIINSAGLDNAVVDTNATDQTAEEAGWTTGHTYNVWYPSDPPTIYSLQYEENLSSGCIRLLVGAQSTQITCDITGQPTRTQYTDTGVIPNVVLNSAAHLIEYLVLEKTSLNVTSVTDTDICPLTFDPTASLGFTNTDTLGIYIKDSSTVLAEVINIMASLGGYIRFGRICILQMFRLVDPTLGDSVLTLVPDSLVRNGIRLTSIELPEKSVNIAYKKNWTIQDKAAVAGSVVDSDNLEFLDQITSSYSNALTYTGVTNVEYPLITDSDEIETSIYNKVDAETESTRRAALRDKKRYIYKLDTATTPFTLNIGDVITVVHDRYGFTDPGKQVAIVGLEEYPTDKRVTLEVWL